MHPRTFRDSARYDSIPRYVLRTHITRLHLQHWIWKEHLGYLLHPAISFSGSDVSVADIGTGNGCWLLDLARRSPRTWSFTGFDISCAQFLADVHLPANVRLLIQDVFEPFPTALHGTFDVVRVRAFAAVIKYGDAGPLTRNLIQLLKPDGFLQWDEFDAGAFRAHAPCPNLPTSCTEEIIRTFNTLAADLNLDWTWMEKGALARTMSQQQLTVVNDIERDRWSDPAEFEPLLRRAYTDNWLMALEETSTVMLASRNRAESGISLEEFRSLLDHVTRETQTGISIWIDLQVVVGRNTAAAKPIPPTI